MGTNKTGISRYRRKQKEPTQKHLRTRFQRRGVSGKCGVLKAQGRSHWCNIPQGHQTKGGHKGVHIVQEQFHWCDGTQKQWVALIVGKGACTANGGNFKTLNLQKHSQ